VLAQRQGSRHDRLGTLPALRLSAEVPKQPFQHGEVMAKAFSLCLFDRIDAFLSAAHVATTRACSSQRSTWGSAAPSSKRVKCVSA
jgi:hypothetical protein